MKLSIITINYNNSLGLARTIESVVRQGFRDYEYCIIDGGSTDGSTEIIDKYLKVINFKICEPDSGIYNAMNKGIKAAKGEYLLFLNSGDTLYHQDSLSIIVPELMDKDFVYGNLMIVEENRSWVKTYPPKLEFSYFIKDTLPHPATFIKRELFDRIGLYNESLKIVADWEFFILAVTKYNCTYKHTPVTISEFMYDGISSKPEFNSLRLSEIKEVLQKHFPAYIKDYEDLERLKRENTLFKKSRVYQIKQKLKTFLKR